MLVERNENLSCILRNNTHYNNITIKACIHSLVGDYFRNRKYAIRMKEFLFESWWPFWSVSKEEITSIYVSVCVFVWWKWHYYIFIICMYMLLGIKNVWEIWGWSAANKKWMETTNVGEYQIDRFERSVMYEHAMPS